jgi:glycosyltransferase involved in cell wall biosynthesis
VRLGFDATSLTVAGKGMARFQREFLRAADEHDLIDELDVFIPLDADRAVLPERVGWRYHPARTSPMIRWELLDRARAARRLGLDVVLTLSERTAPWGPAEVVYIYEHPRHRAKRSREMGIALRQRVVNATTLGLFQHTLQHAAAVVAASRSTARDIGTRHVVYSGVSREFSPSDRPRTYFLHIASDDPRDNSAVVVDAYGRLGADAPPLLIAGPVQAERPALEARARAAGVGIEWRGFQSGAALVELYRGAIAYVDPSLYEGFGLQAAEALACGTPVIASNTTSLPEVVGDGGILLDPHDVAGFTDAMRLVLADGALAADLSARAEQQGASFRWEETVRALVEICDGVGRAIMPAAPGNSRRA